MKSLFTCTVEEVSELPRATYDSAEFMSRTDFGSGVGIVPVRYVDPKSFAGDYTLYLQVERVNN